MPRRRRPRARAATEAACPPESVNMKPLRSVSEAPRGSVRETHTRTPLVDAFAGGDCARSRVSGPPLPPSPQRADRRVRLPGKTRRANQSESAAMIVLRASGPPTTEGTFRHRGDAPRGQWIADVSRSKTCRLSRARTAFFCVNFVFAVRRILSRGILLRRRRFE